MEELEIITCGRFIEVPPRPKSLAVKVCKSPEKAIPMPIETQSCGSFVTIRGDGKGGFFTEPVTPINQRQVLCDELKPLGEDYYEGGDGYYVARVNDVPERVTDFLLRNVVIEHHDNIDGSREIVYGVDVLEDTGSKHHLLLAKDEWNDLGALISHRIPTCHVLKDKVNNALAKFTRIAGLVLKNAPQKVRRVQSYWGWGNRREDSTRLFYHGGREDCSSLKRLFPPIANQAVRIHRLRLAWQLLEVGPHNVTIPLIAYGLAAYLDAIYTDAGYPFNFSMMVVGDSGLLKTALMKVMFAPCVFPVDERIHNVRGTEAAMNLLHQTFFDDVLVIDDFNMEGTPKEVQTKMRLIRASIRDYSDKSAKEKFGSGEKIVKYAIRGGCVITGETRLLGQIRSGELRYLKLTISNPIDGGRLRAFQEDPSLWGFFVSEFIRYCEAHYAWIVNVTQTVFPIQRAQPNLSSLRLVDVNIFLNLTMEIITTFLEKQGAVTMQEAAGLVYEARDIFNALVQEQAYGANERDPYIRYVEEVFNLIGTGKVRIAPSMDAYIRDIERYDGFSDGGLILMKKDELYKNVNSAFLARNEYLPLSTDDVSRLMKLHGLSRCDKRSCLKKVSSKIPGRPRMLALIEKKCVELLEGLTNEKSDTGF